MRLTLRDCTLLPWQELDADGAPQPLIQPTLQWLDAGSDGTLALERTISGALLTSDGVRVVISDSIVDALADSAVALAGNGGGEGAAGRVEIVRSTIIGTVNVRELTLAENSIFTGRVTSDRKQSGCVRFSYLPTSSQVPRRYACQPNLAIQEAIDAAKKEQPGLTQAQQDAIANSIQSWLQPSFSGQRYGQPGYAQLHAACPREIRAGADDDSEMGVFHNLYQIRRETNIRARLDEYLRFGLEAGIFYAT
jgi:cytoskeletal protein CcmA (bactofilin family)